MHPFEMHVFDFQKEIVSFLRKNIFHFTGLEFLKFNVILRPEINFCSSFKR